MLFTNNRYGRPFAKDPAVVKYKNKYYLYHSIFDDNNVLRIDIAVSNDGENWEVDSQIPLTQECEQNGIGAPGAIVLDGIIHLFYQTYGNRELDAICHATSVDGINFTKDPTNPVFRPSTDWCCGRAIDADVCVFNDRLMLYFATRDHDFKVQMLGVASAPIDSDFSRNSFTQAYNGTILKPELVWEKDCIEAPAMIIKNGRLYMFYGGAYNCEPQQIGVAVSDDGINFKRMSDEPFLTNGSHDSWNRCESGHPFVFEDDDGMIYLYYQGSADNGKSWYLSRVKIRFINDKFELV
jgi:predicted GH43/DUF377 family glycosyl hydrolase